MNGVVQLSHFFLGQRVRSGDVVVDATCGNGNDTLVLARMAGPEGMVWAFDLQVRAIEATRELLRREQCRTPVELVHAGHERIGELVSIPVRAIVFNLGYLPGGDKSCLTRPETTLLALSASLKLLLPEGIIVIALYEGHAGGMSECRAVENWSEQLPSSLWNVWKCTLMNRPSLSSWLTVIEKRKDTHAA